MPRIQNKVIVVTGGSRGIGLELVRRLLQQGNTVVATCRQPAAASPALQQLQSEHANALIVSQLEAGDPHSISQWAAALRQQQAGRMQHIDVLVNNAGVSLEAAAQGIEDLDPQQFSQTMSVNALGPMLVVKELLKQGLLGGERLSLAVHISSFAGSCGMMGKTPVAYRQYCYRASKAALNMLVLTSAQELPAHNISSVLLHPGRVNTSMLSNPAHSISPEDSVTGQLQVLEAAASFSELNGRFLSYTGQEVPW